MNQVLLSHWRSVDHLLLDDLSIGQRVESLKSLFVHSLGVDYGGVDYLVVHLGWVELAGVDRVELLLLDERWDHYFINEIKSSML